MKKVLNIVVSLFFLAVVGITIAYANNPGIFSDLNAKLTGKRTGDVVIYTDKDNNPKYSNGTCKKNSDCTPAGCSSHICSNDPDLITTCEYRDDFPDILIYSCGCVNGLCVWFEK